MPLPTTNTRTLFGSLLHAINADCLCDIGSHDGEDAMGFRALLPKARILAFEANPFNHERMAKNPALAAASIELIPVAVGAEKGRATFHVTDVDYSNPAENRGTSSLLVHPGLKVKTDIEVEVVRLDEVVLDKCPDRRRLGLWIDVEGAEHLVVEGMSAIRDCVALIHVEMAVVPLHDGQRTTGEITAMLAVLGFELCGIGFQPKDRWGDAVYIRREAREQLGKKFDACLRKARWSQRMHVSAIAGFL